MTITEMRNKRKKLIETMGGFLDTHKTKNGTLSAEDDKTYKTMEDEITELTNEIHRMERREAIEAELEKPVSKPIIEKPMNGRMDNGEVVPQTPIRLPCFQPFAQTSVMYPMSYKKG